MTTYIGTATSRIDGRAKVTGAAKYAAEFGAAGLVHATVVTSTITKGQITHIDASEALAVDGVIDVLTHRHRPHMASDDGAYKDDVAPEGSPYRPLYDDRIVFNGQPVALVAAREPEIARFAASLVRVQYTEDAHVTELHRRREAAFALDTPANPADNPFAPPRRRGSAERAFDAADVRHSGEYYVPIEHHNPMELYASTVVFEDSGKLTIADTMTAYLLKWIADGGDALYLVDGNNPFLMSSGRGGAYSGNWMSSFSWIRPGVFVEGPVQTPVCRSSTRPERRSSSSTSRAQVRTTPGTW